MTCSVYYSLFCPGCLRESCRSLTATTSRAPSAAIRRRSMDEHSGVRDTTQTTCRPEDIGHPVSRADKVFTGRSLSHNPRAPAGTERGRYDAQADGIASVLSPPSTVVKTRQLARRPPDVASTSVQRRPRNMLAYVMYSYNVALDVC